jgi:hypothetical protein
LPPERRGCWCGQAAHRLRRRRRRRRAAAVSGFCACIGSPCLRHCVHGASIGGARSRAAAAAAEVRAARCHAAVLTELHLCHPCVLVKKSILRTPRAGPTEIALCASRRCRSWRPSRPACCASALLFWRVIVDDLRTTRAPCLVPSITRTQAFGSLLAHSHSYLRVGCRRFLAHRVSSL